MKKHRTLIIVTVVVIAVVVILGALSSRGQRARPTIQSHKVTYQIDGTAGIKADLTYHNASGGTEQKTVTLPWSIEFEARPRQFIYLSGQLDDNGTITCRILIDGQPFKESTSEGAYVIATCSGSVP